MRDKLNNNPKAQVGLIAVLVVVVGFMLLSKSGGGEATEEAAPIEATVSVAEPGVSASAEVSGAAVGIPAAIPAPPMPAPVAAAYQSDKTVVLLVVHDGGIDDKLVQGAATGLSSEPDVALFVVPAKQIAHYAAITLGVDVQRVPALVVMRPRSLSGGIPQASVDYGFQTTQSLVQAVRDASYHGPEETYHPN